MPVILTTPAEVDLWLLADAPKALELQRPLLDDSLRIVANGEKEDGRARMRRAYTGSRANAPALTRVRGFSLTTSLHDCNAHTAVIPPKARRMVRIDLRQSLTGPRMR